MKQKRYVQGEYDLRPTFCNEVIYYPEIPVVGINISDIDLDKIQVVFEEDGQGEQPT